MEPGKFADAMQHIGFKDSDEIRPTFTLTLKDLQHPVFLGGYPKVIGSYDLVNIWLQGGEVAFWAQEKKSGSKLFPFHKNEVDYLVGQSKFKK